MTQDGRNKIAAIGIMILRSDDNPTPRIKQYARSGAGVWKTLEKFPTKAERDRKMTVLLTNSNVIED